LLFQRENDRLTDGVERLARVLFTSVQDGAPCRLRVQSVTSRDREARLLSKL